MAVPEKIGKYEIQELLAKGGMSLVYKGFDRAISRGVAIKAITKSTLAPAELKHVMQRFRHEAQAVGRLVHAGIVQIYDFGDDDDIAYIVMELIQGKTLQQHLAQEIAYEFREVGEIIGQVLAAIGHAHGAGVVHRDIKPSNIMINRDGRIKVGDFGIARIDSSELTQIGDVLGTPHYMAPEQFLGVETDALADLFAIGVIAYELLVGKKPFNGNSATVMHQILNDTPINPSLLNPRLAPLMDRVLQKALSKSRETRFHTAREFAEAFQDALDATLQLGTRPPTPVEVGGADLLAAARLLNETKSVASRSGDSMAPLSFDSAITLDPRVRKARMLVIDDEERILTALKSLFRQRYHVFTTTDGHKALDFMRKFAVHVIVSDQRMPIMPGVELLRRSREISPHAVRILLTGYSDLAAIVGSINDGEIYRFISKPWDNNNLQTIVAEAATIALELADTKARPTELPQQMSAGVLVIDSDEEIFRVVRELVSGLCPVVYAANLDSALALMQTLEIAVVITDVASSQEQLTTMLKVLKREAPQILVIVVTAASDSELVIELINQAQIFRFLNKPVSVRMLKTHIQSALQRYLTFKEAPKLVQANQVREQPAEPRFTSLRQRIFENVRTLRTRWFRASNG